jgi:hypothetical protein
MPVIPGTVPVLCDPEGRGSSLTTERHLQTDHDPCHQSPFPEPTYAVETVLLNNT